MPRPRGPSDPDATRRRIIQAAERCFVAGYHETSLAQIATDAGITAPSVLHYFDNKHALFEEVLRGFWERIAAELAPILTDSRSTEETLNAILTTLGQMEDEDEEMFGAISAALLSGSGLGANAVRDTLLPLCDHIESSLRGGAESAIHPEAPIGEAILYIMAAHGAIHRLGSIAPDETSPVRQAEATLASGVLRAALSWDPERGALPLVGGVAGEHAE